MSREHVTYLQGVYEAYGRGDIPAVLAAMDPNLEWDEPRAPDYPFGGVHWGPQGVANEIFGLYLTYFLEFEAVPQEFMTLGIGSSSSVNSRAREKPAEHPFGYPLCTSLPSMTASGSVSRTIQIRAP